ncbi:MAG TPA: adenylate/guanylate cyclase domain-containing protein, partial [Kofleriaceae bacterium]|nr:adenylate/guanylate cyclase domain-containing protein [Kofleriaceae bacterium]
DAEEDGGRTPAARAARAALATVMDETRGDAVLAAAVARAGAVLHLALLFHLGGDEAPRRGRAPESVGLSRARLAEAIVADTAAGRHPPRAAAATVSMPLIAKGARAAGFVNVTPDADGTVRRVPLVIEHGGRYYMSLGLSLASAALAAPGERAPASYVTGEDVLQVGDRTLPVDRRARAMLSYLGPTGTFRHVSAADLLSGRAAPDTLRDRVVLIGYTDAARDKVEQPFDRLTDGVDIHATLVHNILHGELRRRAEPRTGVLLAALLGAAIALLQVRAVRQRAGWLPGVGAAVLAAGFLVAAQLLFGRGLVVPVVAPVLCAAFVAAAGLSSALATEGREKARLRSAFSRYVPPAVVERIVADPRRVRLGGERRELSVLFSDIHGFTRVSENLEPEVLSGYMSEYLTPMTEIVLDQGGMLDKYIGDAVMAVFGAPIELPDHAAHACRTALAMMRAIGPLSDDFERRGLPRVEVRVGINTGPMAVGNMGSAARFDYTVLGDAVNLGARLEALTRVYGVEIMVGEQTARAAGDELVFRELDTVRVKGRAGVGRVFQLVGERGAVPFTDDDLALFARALAAYREARWDDAGDALREFLERHPDDAPAKVLATRTAGLRAQPPGQDWDGVYDQLVK